MHASRTSLVRQQLWEFFSVPAFAKAVDVPHCFADSGADPVGLIVAAEFFGALVRARLSEYSNDKGQAQAKCNSGSKRRGQHKDPNP